MAKDPRILNQTTGFRLKRNQALTAVADCRAAWVIEGESIRSLTLSEAIQARNEQAKHREPIAASEIPGLIYKQPVNALVSAHERADLIRAANQLVGDLVVGEVRGLKIYPASKLDTYRTV